MSTEATSEEPAPRAKPAKKGMMVKALACLGLLGAGGGAAYGLMLRGMIGEATHNKDDNKPKFVLKGETDPYAPPADSHNPDNSVDEIDGIGGSPYRTTYYSFADEFTSNLRNSGHFVQLSLAASTNYDGRVLMWMKKHELAIRSAILIVLADTTEEEAYSVEGKARLQKRLTAAINQVLMQNEGFGGVKDVLFKSYIVQ